MSAPKKATATVVSRTLAAAGMTKSEKYKVRIGHMRSRGFQAINETTYDAAARSRKVSTGVVFVHWVSGNFARLPGDEEREHAQLGRASEILTAAGFAVETHLTPSGYMHLTVTRPAPGPAGEGQ